MQLLHIRSQFFCGVLKSFLRGGEPVYRTFRCPEKLSHCVGESTFKSKRATGSTAARLFQKISTTNLGGEVVQEHS
jgi:hypothetical protein